MRIFKVYGNETFPEQGALVEIFPNDEYECILIGDEYHEHISDMVVGFYKALSHLKITFSWEYELINPSHPMFEALDFYEEQD